MAKKPKKGDKVLYLGTTYEVTEARTSGNGDPVVACRRPEWLALYQPSRDKLAEIRARQVAADRLTPAGEEEWQACAAEVRKIDAELRGVSDQFTLRADLLLEVPSHNCWGRVGHMLSEAQKDECAAIFGKKPLPGAGEVVALERLFS